MIRMKKLVTSGFAGADEGHILAGKEFVVQNEYRAKVLEESGLAARITSVPVDKVIGIRNSSVQTPTENKASATGPLASHGGETGAETAPLSLDQDHQPRQRRLRKQEAGLDL